jgi:hypothetical protein
MLLWTEGDNDRKKIDDSRQDLFGSWLNGELARPRYCAAAVPL